MTTTWETFRDNVKAKVVALIESGIDKERIDPTLIMKEEMWKIIEEEE